MGLATRSASRSAGNCNAELRVVKDLALVHYSVHYGRAILAMLVMLGLSNIDAVDGAKAMYVFGDSYYDNGNIPAFARPQPWTYPYGITWPGYGTGRWSDGYNQADIIAQLFGFPSAPIAYRYVMSNLSTPHDFGIDFAVGGAGVTYAAFGSPPFDTQVDEMEAFVKKGVVIKHQLEKSVALINFGINDYDNRNAEGPFQTSPYFEVQELEVTVANVVNIIVTNILRLYGLGLRNFIVTNLPLLACIPFAEQGGMYKSCSTNSTLLNETSLQTFLLKKRVRLLNGQLPGIHVVIADQTKAFGQLFKHASDYGFVNPLTPCCYGTNTTADLYALSCGITDSAGKPLYHLCKDRSKALLWDPIHPTEAAWKAVVKLFADVPGYTLEGPMLSTWIKKYNV